MSAKTNVKLFLQENQVIREKKWILYFKGKMKKLLPVIFPYPDFSFSISTL
jgi:hypothetical protein